MNFYQRGIKYIFRQKGKSILLASIFFVSLFICLTGIIILRVTNAQLENLAANSHAHVMVASSDFFSNEISIDDVELLAQLDNIQFINRSNRIDVVLDDEFGMEFTFSGIDDLSLEGPFFRQTKRLVEGSLELADNQIVIDSETATAMEWTIGTRLLFKYGVLAVVEMEVAGIYRMVAAGGLEDQFRMYASPDLVNEFFGEELYAAVSLFVDDPSAIEETRTEIEEKLLGLDLDYHILVSDTLYQNLSAPMQGLRSLVELMLIVTVSAAGIVISLLLSLWVRERRKEVGLLLSMGQMKLSITAQRIFEIFVIFMVAFVMLVLVNYLLITNLGGLIFAVQGVESLDLLDLDSPQFQLVFWDILYAIGLGSSIILISVAISTVPLLRAHPRSILSSVD